MTQSSWLSILRACMFFISLVLFATTIQPAHGQTATLSPTSRSFGSVAVGSSSGTRTVTLTNTGTAALSVSSITTSGDFTQTNTCGSSVAAARNCVITITFKPTAIGARTGTLTVNDGVGTQTASLTGTGTAPITITPATHGFGSVAEGTTSLATSLTVRNGGTTAITGLSIASTNAVFAQTSTCASSLAAAASCTVSVTFSPTAAGAQTGQIQVSYTGVGSPVSATVTGTGVAPITITPASRAFGSVVIGQTSAARTFTITNRETVALPITVASTNTEFAQAGCGSSLAAGTSCTASVTFTPATTATGLQTGQIQVSYTGTGSPQSVSVQGTAVAPLRAQPNPVQFSMMRAVGTPSAPHDVTITNNNQTSAVAIQSIVSTPAAYAITGNTCGSSISAGLSCVVTIVFTPTVVGTTTGTLTITSGGIPLVVNMTGGAQVNNLVSLVITVPNPTLAAGLTEQLKATGTYGNGTTGDVTAAAAWTSSNAAVATVVSNTGVVTGVAAGPAVIRATVTGTNTGTVTNTASVTVTGKIITAVAVSAPLGFIYPLGTDQFTATATYSDGTSGTVAATFSSSNTGVATINSTTGLATGVLSAAGGTTNITATSGGFTSPAYVLTVQGVKSVSAAPAAGASTSIFPFATAQFVATLNYTDGTTGVLPANSVTFASSNPGVATINSSSGLATGVLSAAGGTTNITANMTGIPSVPVALNVYGVQSVTVTPANPTFPLGLANSALPYGPTNNSVPFTATATYTDSARTTANVTSTATWQSSATNVATINTAGTATVTVSAGSLTTSNVSTTITATYGNSGTTLLTVQPPILESVALCLGPYPSSSCGTSTVSVGATLGLNATQQLSATGTYSDNSTQNLTNTATWAAHDPQEVNVNSAGLATVLATDNNAHAVTASFGTVAAYQNSNTGWITASSTAPISCPSPTIDMKLLVVNNSASGYADFPAIQQILNYVGTPYDVVDVTAAAPPLSDGSCHGYYQGVIFANGGDFYSISSWQSTLISYEQTFKVRQVNWYDFPDPNFGLSAYTGISIPATSTYSASFTAAAAPIFFYANTATPVTFSGANIYLVPPSSAVGVATPLLTDSLGNALSVVITYADGRQYLTNTFDSNGSLTHDLVLAYGLLNWVTKGIFLGDYHVYASQHVDDFFIDDSEWIPSTPCLTNPLTQDRTPPDASNLPVFRLNTADMTQIVAWQNGVQNDPSGLFSQFKLTMAFNGVGTAGNGNWTGLTAPVIATSSNNGVATFVAQGFSGLPGQTATVTGTMNAGGIFNGTWTILSVTSSATTTPGTTSFTATVAAAGTTAQQAETGATVTVPDDLVANLQSYQSNFHWISHTYDHPSTLNGLTWHGPPDSNGDDIDLEVLTNLWVAGNVNGVKLDTDPSDIGLQQLTFSDFNPRNMVTPGVTGLNDTTGVPGYLNQDGIQFVVTDTSVIGQANNGPNPSPNVGIVNSFAPGIYEVPRYPNDIFYNAANWADDQAEFVCIYSHYVPPNSPPGTVPAPDPPFNTFNAAQILDFTSSIFVTNMLMGDMNPQMFHQPDLHFSDNYPALTATPFGTPNPPVVIPGLTSPHVSSLISDTYDQTFRKYIALYKLPVLSPTLDQTAVLMQNRNSYNQSGVTASMIGVGSATPQITITMSSTATLPTAVIPVTGLTSTGSEVYGGQNISHINMTPGQTITFPLQ